MVSVVIPLYNTEKYIEKAIESCRCQTYTNIEVIVVDDGSTDGSADIVRDIILLDSRVKLVCHKCNKGLSASRNTGLDNAKGEYIVFVDADDYIVPEFIERCVHSLEENHSEMVIYDADCLVEENISSFYTTNDYDKSGILNFHKVYSGRELAQEYITNGLMKNTWLMFFARDFLIGNNIGFIEGAYYEDNPFFYECMLNARKVTYIPYKLYVHRFHGNSIMTTAMNKDKVMSSVLIATDGLRKLLDYWDHSDDFWLMYVLSMTRDMFSFVFSRACKDNETIYNHIKVKLLDELKKIIDYIGELCLCYKKNVGSDEFQECYRLILTVASAYGYADDDIADLVEYTRNFQKRKLYRTISTIKELGDTNARVGIYGVGRYTEYALDSYLEEGGEVQCDLFYIETDCESYKKKFRGRPVVSIREAYDLSLDAIIVFSTKYNKDMLRKVCGLEDISIYSLLFMTNIPLDFPDSLVDKSFIRKTMMLGNDNQRFRSGEPRLVIVNTPDHRNVGDYLIIDMMEEMIKDAFPNREIVKIRKDEIEAHRGLPPNMISDDDIILIGGGGYVGSMWESGRILPVILRQCKKNRTIIFPQSVYFEESHDKDFWIKTYDEAFREHTNLTMCVREEASLERVTSLWKGFDDIHLFPDCVLMAADIAREKYLLVRDIRKSGVCLCLRTDSESVIDSDSRRQIQDKIYKNFKNVYMTSMHYDKEILFNGECAAIKRKIKEISGAELVITDALHCVIICAITGTRCLAIDNISHKISNTYNWIRDLKYIGCVGSSEDLLRLDIAEWMKNHSDFEYTLDFSQYKRELISLI